MKPIGQKLAKAEAYLRAGNLTNAKRTYRDILSHHKYDPTALNGLGIIAHRHQDYAAAIRYFEEATRYCPTQVSFLCNLSAASACAGRTDKAVDAMRLAINQQPNSAPLHHTLGTLLSLDNKPTEAFAFLERAVTLDPNKPQFRIDLGVAFQQQNELDLALNFPVCRDLLLPLSHRNL